MTDSTFLTVILTRLAYSLPTLLVYAVAFVVAIVNLGRSLAPSLLTIAGVSVMGITTIASAMFFAYLSQSGRSGGMNLGQLATMVSVASTIMHAIGLSLLVTAIFVGRNPPNSPPYK